jgi:hypothetical protein
VLTRTRKVVLGIGHFLSQDTKGRDGNLHSDDDSV